MNFTKGEDIALVVVEVINSSSHELKDLDELITLPLPTYFDEDIHQIKKSIPDEIY